MQIEWCTKKSLSQPKCSFTNLSVNLYLVHKGGDPAPPSGRATLLRLSPSHQPHLRRLLPLLVRLTTSGKTNSHDLTGGVYKTRERIHGDVADSPLLAIPSSCSRVADYNLNWGRLSGFAPPRGFAALCTDHCSTCVALDIKAMRT